MSNGKESKPRFVSPELRSPMLDSLLSIIGSAPDSTVLRRLPQTRPGFTRTGNYDIPTRTVTVSPSSRDKVSTLIHELGHFWGDRTPEILFQLADSLGIDVEGGPGPERLADAYAGLLRHQTGRLKEPPSDSRLLQILRAAASKRAKQGRTE